LIQHWFSLLYLKVSWKNGNPESRLVSPFKVIGLQIRTLESAISRWFPLPCKGCWNVFHLLSSQKILVG
jgi:hypothetical protein